MKSNGNGNLQKHYGALTTEERVRLILEARARGDAQEEHALETSARQLVYRMGEYVPMLRWFGELQILHFSRLLSWALDIAVILGLGEREESKQVRESIFHTASMCAKRLLLERDGWAEFCKREGLRSDEKLNGLLKQAIHGDLVSLDWVYQIAEVIEPDDDDIKHILESTGGGDMGMYKPFTIENVVSDYARAFEVVKG